MVAQGKGVRLFEADRISNSWLLDKELRRPILVSVPLVWGGGTVLSVTSHPPTSTLSAVGFEYGASPSTSSRTASGLDTGRAILKFFTLTSP